MLTTNQQPSTPTNELISQWFDNFISHISVDKMLMETDTASAQTKDFYTDAMSGNAEGMNNYARIQSTQFFISRIVSDYFNELRAFKVVPQKLAFDFSEAKILVWAQISDDDETTENALILSEAKANTKYSDNGFYVSSTIVEEGDNLSVPHHYHEIKLNGRLSGAH